MVITDYRTFSSTFPSYKTLMQVMVACDYKSLQYQQIQRFAIIYFTAN